MAAFEEELFGAIGMTTAHACVLLSQSPALPSTKQSTGDDVIARALRPYIPLSETTTQLEPATPLPFHPGVISMPYVEFVTRYAIILDDICHDEISRCTNMISAQMSDGGHTTGISIQAVPIEIISMIFSYLTALDLLMGM